MISLDAPTGSALWEDATPFSRKWALSKIPRTWWIGGGVLVVVLVAFVIFIGQKK